MKNNLGMNPLELITVYAEKLPSLSKAIRGSLPNHHENLQTIREKGGTRREEMEELLQKLLWGQLQSMGLFLEKNFTIFALKQISSMSCFFKQWFEETLNYLERRQFISVDGTSCTVLDSSPMDVGQLWLEWERHKLLWLQDPNMKIQVLLVEATLRELPDILKGNIPASDLLFPDASMKLGEDIYKNDLVSGYFNGVLADTAIAYIRERHKLDPADRIRILEIGAGTGSTTAMMLPKLIPYTSNIAEYCYTDLASTYLMHAEKEYGPRAPYLTYNIFNVELPLSSQGIVGGNYDLVIATNVLHLTKNIRQTLRNTKAIIKHNGLLLLNEISQNDLFTHLTFGLLEEWWLYEDTPLRIAGCPGLYPETWREMLEREGFRSIYFPCQEANDLGQQIIVAESDGVVRQRRNENQLRNECMAEPQAEVGLRQDEFPKEHKSNVSLKSVSVDLLKDKSTAYFKKLVADTLKTQVYKIDVSVPLEEYGIDSILVVQLTNALRKVFKNVNSTLFYDCQTINAVVDHFIQSQRDTLIKLVGLEEQLLSSEHQNGDKFNIGQPGAGLGNDSRKHKSLLNPASNESAATGAFSKAIQDIAIIGLSGRYPNSENTNTFWNNLKEGRNCITEVPRERWNWQEYFDHERGKKGKIYTKWGGFIDDVDKFDPLFFQISPAEAEKMDPQERLFLEEAYAAIEDSGYQPLNLCDSKKVGVFVGVMNGTYPGLPNYWSIANRISYFLNFQGPSIAIDTACSSSLTAIHLALESLYSGTSDCALAGGVNVVVDPAHYLRMSSMTMLSTGGECKAYGAEADGFIDAEGVGVIVLKPLQKAITDNDHIYGIIKGSMLNAGGKTNGYTVPNPSAQYQVISEALQRAGVDARTISYIEGHGTGTALGDPIEIAGLSRAFGKDTDDKQFCAIGSVKSNIGHCESAAGIAGVTKVLLQLKYGKLVPSLHSKALNPEINFIQTPFVVQHKLTDWERPLIEIDGKLREFPRRAGISSFGAGGANAHVIIEEYLTENASQSTVVLTNQPPAIIVLSAKNEARLQVKVEQLLTALREQSFTDTQLADIAFTLQVGREAMETRVGMVASSITELIAKLKSYLAEKQNAEGVFVGKVKSEKDTVTILSADEDMAQIVSAWIAKGKYTNLLDFWVKGLTIDWQILYGAEHPRRISLPSYPFVRERYWIKEQCVNTAASDISRDSVSALHPLLQHNVSSLMEQCYSSTFTGEEFFLSDHVVKGHRVLPAVAYLEMAREAVSQAAGAKPDERIELSKVVWLRPLVVGEHGTQVHISLYAQGDGDIAFEVYSESAEQSGDDESGEDQTDAVLHSQGLARVSVATAAPRLDLPALQRQCQDDSLSVAQCYAAFTRLGLDYGESHQGLARIYRGAGQVLAQLKLPAPVSDTQGQYVLHPSVLDSALQASLGLYTDALEGEGQAALPFALQGLEILGRCTGEMWAYLRVGSGGATGGTEHSPVQKLDIDVCDTEGRVCARLKGLSARVLEGATSALGSAALKPLMVQPHWRVQAVAPEALSEEAPAYAQRLVVLCELQEIPSQTIETQIAGVRCLKLHTPAHTIGKRFESYAARLFEELQKLLAGQRKGRVLIQVVVPNQGEQQLFTGLSGLLKTARQESSQLYGQVIKVDPAEGFTRLVEQLQENSASPSDQEIQYQEGERWVLGWREVTFLDQRQPLPWKDKRVYLITGGAGGLGLLFAQEIATHAAGARLILTGRSRLDAEKHARLHALERLGARLDYRAVDVSDEQAVRELMQGIEQDYGALNGIIHSAGIIRDKRIVKKRKEEFLSVLSPKVTGVMNIDEASKALSLDFFIVFSSLAGGLGNAGQADYAAGNAFMDAYAWYRNILVAAKQRHGQTLSLNWPLWKDGGMQVDEATEKLMEQTSGLIAMRSATGMAAFYQSLSSGQTQVMVMEGRESRIREKLLSPQDSGTRVTSKTTSQASEAAKGEKGTGLLEDVQTALVQTVSMLLKVKEQDIDIDVGLSEYGFDSVTLTEFANTLNQRYGLELTPTVFFEHPTLSSFSRYLVESYASELSEQFASHPNQSGDAPEQDLRDTAPGGKPRSRFARVAALRVEAAIRPAVPEPIAIIGMSGRFPMARDMEEFWRNLEQEKDCISEIPPERWDWRAYYGESSQEPNKTKIKWGGFIEEVDAFDPLFFGISPKEAAYMDPHQRLLMSYAWKALEDAGYSAQSLSGSDTAIFVGTATSGYGDLIRQENIAIEGYFSTSMVPSVGPNRMSYFLDIHGPSEPIETACSSSLIAIHRAVEALHSGSSVMAIAGGVNTLLTPELHISFSKAGMLSEDGKCKSFSNQANGYVRGEGVGMLVLKRLKAAEQAKDHIYAVIRSSAENHGGRANSLTAPNPKAQSQLLQTAYQKAGIDPRSISYIEAHGTGTELGDPIEINGLKSAFKELYRETGEAEVSHAHCGVGTVKSNIGHLELAAGIAGVMKVILQLKHKKLVKSLHCDTLNPYIDLKDSPFYIVQQTQDWAPLRDSGGEMLPRRAGVSSFGFGGANAHVILEEYQPKTQETQSGLPPQSPVIIVLSAKTEERLRARLEQLYKALQQQCYTDSDLADISYTLQVGREPMEARIAMRVSSIKELEEKLAGILQGRKDVSEVYQGQAKRIKDSISVFSADEDLQKVIDAWVAKGNYAKLLDLWVKGLAFDWEQLHVDAKPRRISLPTYPFAQKKYWVPQRRSESGVQSSRSMTKANTPVIEETQHQSAGTNVIPASLAQNADKTQGARRHKSDPSSHAQKSTSVDSTAELPFTISLRALSDSQVKRDQPLSATQEMIKLSSSVVCASNPTGEHELAAADEKEVISAADLQKELVTSLADALFMETSEIDVNEKFVDMGLDSIVGVEWLQTVNKQYGTSVAATKVYDYPTIQEFARYLQKELNNNNNKRLPEKSEKSAHRSVLSQKTADSETTMCAENTSQQIQVPARFKNADSRISADTLIEELRTSLAAALFIEADEINVDEKFIDMGLDSIVGVEWLQVINKQYGVSVPATKVYDYPSIRDFAAFLVSQLFENGEMINERPLESAYSLTLERMLENVQTGALDIEKAENLLQELQY